MSSILLNSWSLGGELRAMNKECTGMLLLVVLL